VNQPGFPFARDEFDFAPAVQPSSHASKVAAERLKAKGQQGEKARRLLTALLGGDLIDSEIERETGLPRQSICSAAALGGEARARGGSRRADGPVRHAEQTVWRLTEQGRAAVR
jgi:hypothetical protein